MYSSFNARACGLALTGAATIDLAAEAGFGGVDLMVRDLALAGERPDELRRRMDDLGLKGGAFPLPVAWRGDEATFLADLAELPRHAETASTLGLVGTGTWVCPEIPERFDRPGGFTDAVAFHLDRLGKIAEVLTRFDLALALEVIGVESSRTGRSPRFITRLGELSPIARPLARDRGLKVGLLLDVFHLHAADETLEQALAEGKIPVHWVHFADLPGGASPDRSAIEDAVRGLPGDHGAINSRAILRALQTLGYTGPVTAEPLARCPSLAGLNARSVAFAVVRAIRSVWPT